MGLNKNVTILRNYLSVPVRCLFPFINSKASPSDYIYSSVLKPSKNEPFNCQKVLLLIYLRLSGTATNLQQQVFIRIHPVKE